MKYDNISIRPSKNRPYHFAGQSQAGAYANSENSSVTTYDALENIIDRVAEGGYVVDKRHLPIEIAVKTISGPIQRPGLPPLTIDDWGKQQSFSSINEFFKYLSMRTTGISMCYFSLDLYAEWWKRLGAKVGRVKKGKVVWQ